jgi:hypothetical protein
MIGRLPNSCSLTFHSSEQSSLEINDRRQREKHAFRHGRSGHQGSDHLGGSLVGLGGQRKGGVAMRRFLAIVGLLASVATIAAFVVQYWDQIRALVVTDPPEWASCSWTDVGYDRSHFNQGDWCPAGSFLTQLDLDSDHSHSTRDSPVVGRARCCRLAAVQAERWGSCDWSNVGYEKSRTATEEWCLPGRFLAQLDLDGGQSHGEDDWPIVGAAKCCSPYGMRFAKWGRSEWRKVRDSHEDTGEWCPDGSFVTQLVLEGGNAAHPWEFPVIQSAKCTMPSP